MRTRSPGGPHTGMQLSPWIILGSTIILLIVVMVLAFQNTNREKRYMSELLTAKGAALIRAVEAGARTGMMGMMWGGQQIQLLLEETARLPDVLYMAVMDQSGRALAHSDPSKINKSFDPNRKVAHLGPHQHENWELVTLQDQQRVFEVHRHFRPLDLAGPGASGHMRMMMRGRGMRGASNDWFSPDKRQKLLVIVGLDVTPFEEAIRSDIQTTIILSIVMLLLGFGGFVSLFWMHSYRAARQSLQDTSAFADEVVSHLPVGLIATDKSGRITFFNEAAEKITELNRSVAQNKTPDALLPEGLCGVQEILGDQKKITEREVECTFSENKTVPLSVSATGITNDAGEFLGQVLILRDLSEIRRLQEEVRRQEKLAAMGGLAAGVAHEVRNPLSSIKALATFFADQFDEGSEAQEAAGIMIQEVERLNRAITELLEFARPSDLNRQSTEVDLLISRSLKLIQQDVATRNITIHHHTESAICPAFIDPDRFSQCLLNVYLNAIQAMEDGGNLTVQCTSDAAEMVKIVVSDTGQGIPKEHIDKIFDPYFTTKNKGTGLGLGIVYKIIEAHEGHIEVNSIPGQGTAVSLWIPCYTGTDERG
ncbi:Sensor protein of zinc sigma-54-dependent two-component system [Olavius algarvensis associated proteobacterium Delta 3]|nr:Sensor protein of zinc sigma-54-dependent two-component system [Olavius algarvensis associated proteobacterium Delta 3]CAB5150058.1 Sensor protein of zinc sigma-54-dependent two-component system [Olavius algarvensis associated proteobacterium Delta 3]